MRLYFNGCSFTAGDELENPAQEAYPCIVAQQRGCDFLNDAVPGGSNDRVWMRTMQHIDQFDMFYIQWTFANRFTLYDPENQWEVCFFENLQNIGYKNKDHFSTFGKYYYTYWDNPYQNYIRWLNQIISLQTLFERYNKRYMMYYNTKRLALPFPANLTSIPIEQFNKTISERIPIDNLPDDLLESMHTNIEGLLKKIDRTKFIDNGNWNPNEFDRDEEARKRWRAEFGHGNKDWHHYVANYVMTAEQKMYENI